MRVQRLLGHVALTVACLCVATPMGAQTAANEILLIDSGPAALGGPNIFVADPEFAFSQFVAQQFTLPAAALITEIAPFLGRIGTGPDPIVKVQLTDAIGPGTAASAVRFEALVTVSNALDEATFVPIPTFLVLSAGTYFLVLSSDAEIENSAVWGQDAPTDIGPDFRTFGADIEFSFPPASSFVGDFADDLGLRISGSSISGSPTFLGSPGSANCHGRSISGLITQFGSLSATVPSLGFPSMRALHDAIREFCTSSP